MTLAACWYTVDAPTVWPVSSQAQRLVLMSEITAIGLGLVAGHGAC